VTLSEYTPLSEKELADAIAMACKLNSRWFPKGRNRRIFHPEEEDFRAGIFAQRLAQHLTQANYVIFKGPPLGGHSTPAQRQK
jgi:hypothetical protein